LIAHGGYAPYRAHRVEALGTEVTYGVHATSSPPREVVLRIAIEHDEKYPLEVFLHEHVSPVTSMSPGTTHWFGAQGRISPIARVHSVYLSKSDVPAYVDIDNAKRPVELPDWTGSQAGVEPSASLGLSRTVEPDVSPAIAKENLVPVRLIDIAHGRSGDKGNTFNVGIIAREPEYLPYIRASLTPEAVGVFFAHEFDDGKPGKVERFDLPGLNALNFLVHDALGGGQLASLRVDALAKGKAQQLLEAQILVPEEIAARALRRRSELKMAAMTG
jgi:hypothetical protein